MHDCRKFRERVIGAGEAQVRSATAAEGCPGCGRFLAETLAVYRALDSGDFGAPGPAIPDAEEAWRRFETGFRRRLAQEPAPRFRPLAGWIEFSPQLRRLKWPAFAAAAACLALIFAVGPFRPDGGAPPTADVVESPLPLDPRTVEFLGRSEMFLRTFAKIDPADTADIRDARERARTQVAALARSKAGAAAVPPVWTALEDYESVLREIKNLDDASADADVRDIQARIARWGLIATMKGYQPRVERIAYRPGR
jgi:hypothetical protein